VKAFGYPVVPGVYLVAVAVLMVILLFEKPLYTWPGLIIVALGVPVYYVWHRGRT
jgi:APA family basic amino acid/polyamine antiporter